LKTTVKLSGFKELDRALGELPKATGRNVLKRVLVGVSEPIAETMQGLAPEQWQDLKETIAVTTVRPKTKKRKPKRSTVEVYTGPGRNPQAELQENGTSRHPPQPFARPAWDRHKDGLLPKIGEELGSEIEKAATRLAKKRARAAARG
jgi:HK97 gp10 family phage protein